MFLPIGGVFVFGNGTSPGMMVIMGFVNAVMGGVTLAVGYGMGFLPLIVIGYIIAGAGALMVLFNIFKLRGGKRDENVGAFGQKLDQG